MPILKTVVLVLAALSLTMPAEGQGLSDEDRQEARDWAAEASRLYDEEDFQGAYEAFLRVHEVVESPGVKYNMARCLSRLGRFSEAIVLFAAVLEDPSFEQRDLPEREIRLAQEAQAEVVFSGASGIVRLGIQSCTSPCSIRVDPGEHDYVFEDERRSLELGRGERREIVLVTAAVEYRRGPYRPGWGTAIGVGLVAVGAAGTIGFGLRTEALADEFIVDPTQDVIDDGVTSRRLTNISIAVAAAGAAIVLVEVLVRALRRRPIVEASAGTATITW